MTIRVLHWYPNFLGGGGVANAVLGLAESQARAGVRVGIAAATADGPALYEPMEPGDGVTLLRWAPVWRVRAGSLAMRGMSRDARELVRQFAPTVIHVHGEFNPDNLWVPYLRDCPLVLSPHGAFHPVALAKGRRFGKSLYRRLVRPLLYDKVAAFHALSPAEQKHIRRVLSAATVYTVPQGGSLGDEGREIQAAPAAGDRDTVTYVFVGRLDVFTKGLDILIKAFARVREEAERKVCLRLIGPDQNGGAEQLRRLARTAACAEDIDIVGPLPREALTRTVVSSDIYVQLSRHEGFCLALTDALLLGKPAIASSEIGLTSFEVVRRLEHVCIVPPDSASAARAMMEFGQRPASLAIAARRRTKELREFFSWERVGQEHLDVYEKLA